MMRCASPHRQQRGTPEAPAKAEFWEPTSQLFKTQGILVSPSIPFPRSYHHQKGSFSHNVRKTYVASAVDSGVRIREFCAASYKICGILCLGVATHKTVCVKRIPRSVEGSQPPIRKSDGKKGTENP